LGCVLEGVISLRKYSSKALQPLGWGTTLGEFRVSTVCILLYIYIYKYIYIYISIYIPQWVGDHSGRAQGVNLFVFYYFDIVREKAHMWGYMECHWGPCTSFSCQILGRSWDEVGTKFDDCNTQNQFLRNSIPKWSNIDHKWADTPLGGERIYTCSLRVCISWEVRQILYRNRQTSFQLRPRSPWHYI